MCISEDDKYYSEKDNQEMVTANIRVVFYINVDIPSFDKDKIDPEEMLEQAVKEHEFKAEDIENWEFQEWV